ncbi:MAG TPA: hypothetical protein VJN64_17265 [Terriglobales bacterium]|nr:hypothetical protein [Terriglobales bacterium]
MKTTVWLILVTLLSFPAAAQKQAPTPNTNSAWHFAVSGDSRNCGNVVMPAIAVGVRNDAAAFYWHLGDLRVIDGPDEDYKAEPEHRGKPVDRKSYLENAWPDFIHSQLQAFAPMPFFIGIGNHEIKPPKTREEFVRQFSEWLDSPVLRKQRLADNPNDNRVRTYYHWIQGGVDFMYLDNATPDQFDDAQMKWVEGVLQRAEKNPAVKSVVVGMHEALPDSLAAGHSMNNSQHGAESGRRVYRDLIKFHQQSKKNVYILASHSHFYMSGIFNSDAWRSQDAVLPGWIIGTAGAVRYALPPDKDQAREALTKVYGYLLGTVNGDGSVDFKFQQLSPEAIHAASDARFGPDFVNYCIEKNADFK